MDICIVSPKIHNFLQIGEETGVGGAERQQYLLAQRLVSHGHAVSIVTRNFDNGARHARSQGLDIWKTLPDVRGVSGAPLKSAALFRTLRQIDPDACYVRGNDFLCMVVSTYCQFSDTKFVYGVSNDADVDPRHLRDVHPLRRRAFVSAIRGADAVVAQTERQRSILEGAYGVEAPIIPNGYEIPPAADVLPHDEREFVLWVGRIDSRQKKPERFLSLARNVEDHRFVMVGAPNDDEVDYYERIRSEAEAISNLSFEGFVPPDRVHHYFRHAMMLVNTSDYEGLPNVFLEAWRYATPVVSLYYSYDGKFDGGDIGLYSGSFDTLVDDVERLCTDAVIRDRLGENGREYLEANHSLDRVYDRYVEVFTDVVEERE